MISYTLAHVGINCANAEEARKGAALFEAMFGLTMKERNSSVFAGKAVELMKSPYLGLMGHIAIRTNSISRAVSALEARGFHIQPDTAKYKNGRMQAVYLDGEYGGFAVHLVQK